MVESPESLQQSDCPSAKGQILFLPLVCNCCFRKCDKCRVYNCKARMNDGAKAEESPRDRASQLAETEIKFTPGTVQRRTWVSYLSSNYAGSRQHFWQWSLKARLLAEQGASFPRIALLLQQKSKQDISASRTVVENCKYSPSRLTTSGELVLPFRIHPRLCLALALPLLLLRPPNEQCLSCHFSRRQIVLTIYCDGILCPWDYFDSNRSCKTNNAIVVVKVV